MGYYSDSRWINLLTSHKTGEQFINEENGDTFETSSICNLDTETCYEFKSDRVVYNRSFVDYGNGTVLVLMSNYDTFLTQYDLSNMEVIGDVKVLDKDESAYVSLIQMNNQYYMIVASKSDSNRQNNKMFKISNIDSLELEEIRVDEAFYSAEINGENTVRLGENKYLLSSLNLSCSMGILSYSNGALEMKQKSVESKNGDPYCLVKGVNPKEEQIYFQSWKDDENLSSIVITDLELNVITEFELPKDIDVNVSFISSYN